MELLVVIAIIGILASIVLVSLGGARQKARTAKSLQFASSIESGLGAYAVGKWDFDEGSGPTANDASGYNNNGTLVNNPTWRCASVDASYTPTGKGCSLYFNGSNNYVSIPNNSLFNIQKLTITTWVNFADNSASFIFEKGNVNTQYSLFSHGTDIVFRTVPISGSYDTLSTSKANAGIINGEWVFIVATFDGSVKKVYVNGNLILSRNWAYTINTNPNGAAIGRFGGTSSGYYFTGMIDEVKIYGEALSPTQIESLYAEGVKRLGLAEKQTFVKTNSKKITYTHIPVYECKIKNENISFE